MAAAVYIEDRAMDDGGLAAGQVADRRGDLLRGSRAGSCGELVQLVALTAVPSVRVGPG